MWCLVLFPQGIQLNLSKRSENSKHAHLAIMMLKILMDFRFFHPVLLWRRLIFVCSIWELTGWARRSRKANRSRESTVARGTFRAITWWARITLFTLWTRGSWKTWLTTTWICDRGDDWVAIKCESITLLLTLIYMTNTQRLFIKTLHINRHYLNQNHQFLVAPVVLGVLEILDHQVYRQYHEILDHPVDLQPVRVETLTQGCCFG